MNRRRPKIKTKKMKFFKINVGYVFLVLPALRIPATLPADDKLEGGGIDSNA